MERGWIKIWRKMLDNFLYPKNRPFTKFEAWLDILLQVNHQETKILLDNKPFTITEGCMVTSIKALSERWKWSRHKISNFLELLENENQIVQKRDTKRTYLNVLNYDTYNSRGTQKGHQKDIKRTSKGHQKDTNKNNKNDKNDKNIYIAHFDNHFDKKNAFDDVYKHYPRKQGKKQAIRHFNASVKTEQDFQDIQTALKNYLASREVKDGYIQYASTWFNNWRDWVDAQNTANNAVLSNSYLLACQTQKNEKKQQKQRIQAILSGKPTVQTIANYILHHPEDENQVIQAIADKTLKRGVKENLTAERNKFSQMITQITKKLPSISKTGD